MLDENIFTRIFALLKRLRRNPNVVKFIKHNVQAFLSRIPSPQGRFGGPVVLMEINSMQSAHIAYSYLAYALATTFNAEIYAYVPRSYRSHWRILAFKLQKLIGFEELGIYKSFGVKKIMSIQVSREQKMRALREREDMLANMHTKRDIEALTIHDVYLGDLIYDSYLRRFSKPTIELGSDEFKSFFLESIELFFSWESYFDKYDVQAVSVSHCVYDLAIPLRLAVARGIPVFQASLTHVYRMSKKNLFAYNDFHYFREKFAALPAFVRQAGIAEAQRRIELRLAGKVGVDMAYSKKSAYGSVRYGRLIRKSPQKKILIATHCFFDSPHSYGGNIFPDFYEWLDFIGRLTQVTDYDWYIKTHPDYLPGTRKIIENFIIKYPKFTLLPPDASHHQIVSEGIDCALTVYGTIAFEYAALGIPVINCSQNNPHIAYGFNIHPRDIEEYRNLLINLGSMELNINSEQVYEYYFMRHIFNTENIFFNNYSNIEQMLGGYRGQFSPAIYDAWLSQWTPEKHLAIIAALHEFIKSGEFRMDYSHSGREMRIDSIMELQ